MMGAIGFPFGYLAYVLVVLGIVVGILWIVRRDDDDPPRASR
jgi:hypothetical protein